MKLYIVSITFFSTFILLFGNLGNIFTRQEAMILLFTSNIQGRSQDFSKGGSPSGDRRLYMVYTAALPCVSAGSVVLSRHEGPY